MASNDMPNLNDVLGMMSKKAVFIYFKVTEQGHCVILFVQHLLYHNFGLT
jgi:hypothetical protein